MGERQDDEEIWGLEGGYSSDRWHSRHSLDYHCGKLGENLSAESEGEDEEEGKDSDGKRVHHCLRSSKMISDIVLESPTKKYKEREEYHPCSR
jgi:hypothetical protein